MAREQVVPVDMKPLPGPRSNPTEVPADDEDGRLRQPAPWHRNDIPLELELLE
ncbi:hypothetical protein [Streptomyces sp. NPDC056549]|uniref:hypothetical protein n=1 Tax=Streptomyces sp. NPDC056549 TaxID=3345864 RepID=UPI00367C7A2C